MSGQQSYNSLRLDGPGQKRLGNNSDFFRPGERALDFAGEAWKWIYGGIKYQHVHVASIGAGARWPFASRRGVVCCTSIQGPKPRRESSKPSISSDIEAFGSSVIYSEGRANED